MFWFVSFRTKLLQIATEERIKQLEEFGKDGGAAASQGFLAGSVEPPWERAVTPNKVPYYIKLVYFLLYVHKMYQ